MRRHIFLHVLNIMHDDYNIFVVVFIRSFSSVPWFDSLYLHCSLLTHYGSNLQSSVLTECQDYANSLTKAAELIYAAANLWFIKSVFFPPERTFMKLKWKFRCNPELFPFLNCSVILIVILSFCLQSRYAYKVTFFGKGFKLNTFF